MRSNWKTSLMFCPLLSRTPPTTPKLNVRMEEAPFGGPKLSGAPTVLPSPAPSREMILKLTLLPGLAPVRSRFPVRLILS